MVAEGTGELRVQIPCHLLLRRGLSFGLAATHFTQTESSLCEKETENKRLQQGESVRWIQTTKEEIREKS